MNHQPFNFDISSHNIEASPFLAPSFSTGTNLPAGSESTDPISLEEEEDPLEETVVSAPTTPQDPDKNFLANTPDRVSTLPSCTMLLE